MNGQPLRLQSLVDGDEFFPVEVQAGAKFEK
jgi:hypothetical protein